MGKFAVQRSEVALEGRMVHRGAAPVAAVVRVDPLVIDERDLKPQIGHNIHAKHQSANRSAWARRECGTRVARMWHTVRVRWDALGWR